jgi:hypothetical protein
MQTPRPVLAGLGVLHSVAMDLGCAEQSHLAPRAGEWPGGRFVASCSTEYGPLSQAIEAPE